MRLTISSISPTRFTISFSGTFFTRSPNAIFSYTLRWGKRAYLWNTVFTFLLWGGTPLMRCPSKKTSPLVGSRKPAIMRRVVVFPHPEGPRKVTNSLSFMSRLIFFRMRSPSSNSTIMSFKLTIFSIKPFPSKKLKCRSFVSFAAEQRMINYTISTYKNQYIGRTVIQFIDSRNSP